MRLCVIISSLLLSMTSQAQKTYLDSSVYENGQLEAKGLYYQVGNRSWQWGIWEYWYEDGVKELELWSDRIKTKYVNMWLPDGTQILKSGNGFYYSIEPQQELNDSLVYQIKDSIKNGDFRRFRSYKHTSYFIIEKGHYENEKEAGIWYFRDTVLKTSFLQTYKNGKQDGVEIRYFMNGEIEDSVNYVNGEENGNYKEYSNHGILLKDCNYKDGRLINEYKEYYSNGKLKTEGNYTQGKGDIQIQFTSVGRRSGSKRRDRIENRLITNKPLKQGVWKFYNRQGALEKTEKYLDGQKM